LRSGLVGASQLIDVVADTSQEVGLLISTTLAASRRRPTPGQTVSIASHFGNASGRRHGRGTIGRLAAAALAAGTVVALAACDGSEPPPAAAAAPVGVTVARVASIEVTPAQTFTGRIEAIDKVDLRARVEGFIEKRMFQEGADVNAGDLMMVLETGPYDARIGEVKASIARAKAALDLADVEVKRQSALVQRGNTAQSVLDQAIAKQGVARADLQQATASLSKAELDLGYTAITSPISGRVGESAYSVGNFVSPSSGTLATIVSQDPIYVTFPVTQRELLQVRQQAEASGFNPRDVRVKVRMADGSIYAQVGSINFVDVKVDPTTDTVIIRAQLPNPDRTLIDGQLVTAIVEAVKPEMALAIPTEALQLDQTGRFVLVVDDANKVEVRPVEISKGFEGQVLITKGLKEGERVITVGTQKVRPGVVVAPTEAAPAPVS
jgi:membrane fusion protein (multidrug efflux system)